MPLRKKSNTVNLKNIIKIPYFDEDAAQDYIDIKNGGHLDWSTDENKEKLAKIVAEIDSEVGGGINIFAMLKAAFQGKGELEYSSAITKVIDSKLKNTLLTDYLAKANNDKKIVKFQNISVYPYPNSFTMYKMFSSYLAAVPKDDLPIDIEKLNQAMLGERGYYEMIADDLENKSILRFNINAFRNGYNLTDLSKMKLIYYGVPVGKLELHKLAIDKEFEYVNQSEIITAEMVFGEYTNNIASESTVYDIVIAGVARE